MKYRDNMTPAELEQFQAELDATDAAYARNATRPYRVSWVIDVDARDPIEAARIAKQIHDDPESAAVFYDVKQYDPTTGHSFGKETTVNAETWGIERFAYNELPEDELATLQKAGLSRGQP